MTLNAALAAASRAMNAFNDRLPASAKLNLEAEWGALEAQVSACRSEGAARMAVIEWRQGFFRRSASPRPA